MYVIVCKIKSCREETFFLLRSSIPLYLKRCSPFKFSLFSGSSLANISRTFLVHTFVIDNTESIEDYRIHLFAKSEHLTSLRLSDPLRFSSIFPRWEMQRCNESLADTNGREFRGTFPETVQHARDMHNSSLLSTRECNLPDAFRRHLSSVTELLI